MGRGRAKAKQTKVARDLKYRTHETDFGALARELHGESDSDTETDQSSDDHDEWSDYAEPSRDGPAAPSPARRPRPPGSAAVARPDPSQRPRR
jgi:hypothetical protein